MKPNVKRFVDLGKQVGLKVMLHSCGGVREILPDLIEIGMDALNPVQVDAAGMEPAALKRDFGDRICFHGAIDHQHILPNGTVDEVRAEVRRIIDIMEPGGGYCLAASHDLLLAEFPLENIVAMYDEGFEYGRRFGA
jgi:uroporphyrinogen decarboxylase